MLSWGTKAMASRTMAFGHLPNCTLETHWYKRCIWGFHVPELLFRLCCWTSVERRMHWLDLRGQGKIPELYRRFPSSFDQGRVFLHLLIWSVGILTSSRSRLAKWLSYIRIWNPWSLWPRHLIEENNTSMWNHNRQWIRTSQVPLKSKYSITVF